MKASGAKNAIRHGADGGAHVGGDGHGDNGAWTDLGEMLRQQRVRIPLTLQELAARSKVSPSHLGRIERSERFPSARVLKRIAGPLGFELDELFTMAGYLTPQPEGIAEPAAGYGSGHLDPYVAKMLAQEPVEVQRAVIAILIMLKNISQSLPRK